MPTYNVPVSFTMLKTMEIEASTEAEARAKAFTTFCEDQSYLDGANYLEDSFEIDGEILTAEDAVIEKVKGWLRTQLHYFTSTYLNNEEFTATDYYKLEIGQYEIDSADDKQSKSVWIEFKPTTETFNNIVRHEEFYAAQYKRHASGSNFLTGFLHIDERNETVWFSITP